MRIVYRPITAEAHFFADQPIGGLLQRGMLRRNSGFSQRDNVDRSVPDRRETGLYAKIVAIMDKESREIFFRLGINGICFGIAERSQCNQTVQHRWIHRGEAVTAFANPFNHPALRFFERAPAHRAKPQWTQEFQKVIDSQKEIAPCPELFAARKAQIGLLGAQRVKLVELLFAGQNASWLEMVYDSQRHAPSATS